MAAQTTIEHKKLELIQWISVVEDVDVIDKMLDVKKHEIKDWWDDLSEAEKVSIEKGIEEADAGKLIPHEEVRKIYEKYL